MERSYAHLGEKGGAQNETGLDSPCELSVPLDYSGEKPDRMDFGGDVIPSSSSQGVPRPRLSSVAFCVAS
jgi:hypothetical protein